VGLFHPNPARIGCPAAALPVRAVAELEAACRELDATIGVIATPDESAQEVCDLLVKAGVRCILSFAASPLDVPKHVEIRRVDLAVEMQVLSFHSARNAESEPAAASAAVGLSSANSASTGSDSTTNGSVMAP
ncbi:redox-sensing transcriptional repressor Rex, partial [Rhodococcus sp. NPDC058514]